MEVGITDTFRSDAQASKHHSMTHYIMLNSSVQLYIHQVTAECLNPGGSHVQPSAELHITFRQP